MISRKHKMLLEAFENSYTPEDLLNTIRQIKDEHSDSDKKNIVKKLKLTSEKTSADDTETSNDIKSREITVSETGISEATLNYIKFLEGSRIRLRELHWSTENKSEHLLTDELMEEVESFEDGFAEETMGILGVRIQVGDITPNISDKKTTREVLDDLIDSTLIIRASYEDDVRYSGIVSLIDDFLHFLNKGKYLETLK